MLIFVESLYRQRHLVWNLVKSDFRNRYVGSMLGVLWAFLMPLVNLSVMWVAFEFGFKASPKSGVPFILWLVSGMFPWMFFLDSVQSGTMSIIEKSFLVKKIVFSVELLPLIKILAAGIPFIFLSVVMLVLFGLYGYSPDIYWLQILYYTFCLIVLAFSLTMLTSAVVIFYRDLGQVISMGLQLGFWGTPIFWSPEQLPKQLGIFNFINPVSYIITGFRESLISKVWFWQNANQTCYFWAVVLIILFFGQYLFKKLRPHFADVL